MPSRLLQESIGFCNIPKVLSLGHVALKDVDHEALELVKPTSDASLSVTHSEIWIHLREGTMLFISTDSKKQATPPFLPSFRSRITHKQSPSSTHLPRTTSLSPIQPTPAPTSPRLTKNSTEQEPTSRMCQITTSSSTPTPENTSTTPSPATIEYCPAFLYAQKYAKEHAEKEPEYRHCVNYETEKRAGVLGVLGCGGGEGLK